MKYKSDKEEYKSSAKEFLWALVEYSSYAKMIKADKKPYSSLLNWLLKNANELNNEDTRLPLMKVISKEVGIDSSKIKNYLKAIYDDIIELNWNEPHKFVKEGQTFCYLYFHYFRYTESFILGLNNIPRVGENIEFRFMKPRIQGTNFYVNRVEYCIENNQQIIFITLSWNEENLYLRLLSEKARLRGDLSLMSSITYDYDNYSTTKDKLVKMYSNL